MTGYAPTERIVEEAAIVRLGAGGVPTLRGAEVEQAVDHVGELSAVLAARARTAVHRDTKTGETRGGRARLLDFDSPGSNDFLVVR